MCFFVLRCLALPYCLTSQLQTSQMKLLYLFSSCHLLIWAVLFSGFSVYLCLSFALSLSMFLFLCSLCLLLISSLFSFLYVFPFSNCSSLLSSYHFPPFLPAILAFKVPIFSIHSPSFALNSSLLSQGYFFQQIYIKMFYTNICHMLV